MKRYYQKHDSIYKSSNYEKNGLSAMPRSKRFSDWNFHHVFETHVTSCKCTPDHPFSFLFHTSHGHFFFFTDLWIRHTSFGKQKKKNGWHLKGWLVHKEHRVKKSRLRTYYWAGRSQSTVLAAPWVAQLVWVSVMSPFLLICHLPGANPAQHLGSVLILPTKTNY